MDILSAAAVLVRFPGAVLSHEEAARQLGVELRADTGIRRITVPRSFSHVIVHGWQVRRCDVQCHVLASGMRLTGAAQLVVDLARVLPFPDAVVAGDSVLRKRLATLPEVAELASQCRGRGRPAVQAVLAALDPASGSVLESLFRVLVCNSGLPAPATQVSLADGDDVLGRFDFCWREQRLVVELDGYAFHSDRWAFEQDRKRANALQRLGWRLLRFTWEDVVNRPGYVVQLLREVLAQAA